jgi:hypothetical protein
MRSPCVAPGSPHWIERARRPKYAASTSITRIDRYRDTKLAKCLKEIFDDEKLVGRVADLKWALGAIRFPIHAQKRHWAA